MNIKILGTLLILQTTFFIHTGNTHNNQIPETNFHVAESAQNFLYAPVRFSSSGIQQFLEKTYNHPNYTREILPNNLSHFTQFLQHGYNTGQPRSYVKQVVRLFCNRLKGASYVNSYAFSNLLQDVTPLLENSFVPRKSSFDILKQKVNNILCSTLDNPNPRGFENATHQELFGDISQEIIKMVNSEIHLIENVALEELRKTVLIFLETGLNKLVWAPEDKQETWTTVKNIADHLTTLLEANVITDPEDLNGLFISLLERYCYFLDLTGAELTADFYDHVKKDVTQHASLFLELEESERFIETKYERLMRALMEGEAKVRAQEHGFVIH